MRYKTNSHPHMLCYGLLTSVMKLRFSCNKEKILRLYRLGIGSFFLNSIYKAIC